MLPLSPLFDWLRLPFANGMKLASAEKSPLIVKIKESLLSEVIEVVADDPMTTRSQIAAIAWLQRSRYWRFESKNNYLFLVAATAPLLH